MIVVYIASPYTLGDKEQNVVRQIKTANELMNFGFCPVVPLLTHFQDKYYPRTYEEWMWIDVEKVLRCDVVLRLDGVSHGADREVEYAYKNGIPVVHSIQELIQKKEELHELPGIFNPESKRYH